MNYQNLMQKVLAATNNGKDIITECCPAAAEVANSPKKKFRLRPGERTPSAQLYPPRSSGDCWHVKDFGMGDGESYFSPVDLYMWTKGYGRDKFMMALQELAECYGVQEELKSGVNKPLIAQRPATAEDEGRLPHLELMDGFSGLDLSTWGPQVKPCHLEALGWHGVRWIETLKDGKVTRITATDTYPIYAQQCPYLDDQGREMFFWKVYEPCNPDKAFRFRIIWAKPRDYLFGLSSLVQAYHRNNDEKLNEVLLVSGGSDAVCALAMGYQPVWLDSETRQLMATQLSQLLKYAMRVIAIPDIDETGVRMGVALALAYPTLYSAWLKKSDFGGTHDNRLRPCKDLRDYLRLHPSKQAMDTLVRRARCAQFWSYDEKRSEYVMSPAAVSYFLWLHGYCTRKDDTQKEPLYVQVSGHVVREVTAKTIRNFLKEWCEKEGVSEALQNKLLSMRSLPSDNTSQLTERADLDFTSYTENSQTLYFRNAAVTVTADKITQQPTSHADGHYVWEKRIIQHDFRTMPRQFTVTTDDNGLIHVHISDDARSKVLRFLVNSSRLYWRKEMEQGLALTPEEQDDQEQCLLAKLLNLGSHLHRYKSSSEARATICLDYAMSDRDDACNGRSGKSFFLDIVRQMTCAFDIDGKTFHKKSNLQFIYDGVTDATDTIIVDECTKDFNYDFFLGQITNQIRVERKGKDSRIIPFSQSPKLMFATNFTLKKHDPSTDARLWPQVFSDYYHVKTDTNDYQETRTIHDDFQQDLLRDGYRECDWQADIHLMLECLQLYLSMPVGKRQLIPPMQRIQRREQQALLGKDFRQWADENLCEGSEYIDREVRADELLAAFNHETGYNWPPKKFTERLKEYCKFAAHIHCYNPATVTGKEKDGERIQHRDPNNKKLLNYYFIQSKALAEQAAEQSMRDEETALPF